MRAASERTEPIKGVTMEEVVRRENLKKALKRVCANKGGNAEPFLCRKRAPFPLRSLRVFSKDRMNRRVRLPAAGRDPYARWCGRAKVVRPSPIPIVFLRLRNSDRPIKMALTLGSTLPLSLQMDLETERVVIRSGLGCYMLFKQRKKFCYPLYL